MGEYLDEYDLRDKKLWPMHEFFGKHEYKLLSAKDIMALSVPDDVKMFFLSNRPYVSRCCCGSVKYV